MKLSLGIFAFAALAGCSAEKTAAPAGNSAESAAVAGNEAEGGDSIATGSLSRPDSAEGITTNPRVATGIMRAAFMKSCPFARFVQHAECAEGSAPNQYNCKYVLTGKDAEGMKPITIVGSGSDWDFVEKPNRADCENK